MKKFIPFAVAAALMLIPSSAMAASGWGGWQGQHSDNLASPDYPTTFGNNGAGNSQYCVDPTTSSTHCSSSGVYSPVVFAGVLVQGPRPGCSHEDAGKTGAANVVPLPPGPGDPCSPTSGDSVGAAYVGTAGNNTDGNASSPSPVAPGTGIAGVQG
jgi:hypothetical protein